MAKKKKFIKDAIKKEGSFTEQAKAAGMTPAEFQEEVLSNPDKYSATTVRRANLRKTLVKQRESAGRLKLQAGPTPYALPTSMQVTSTMQNISADPAAERLKIQGSDAALKQQLQVEKEEQERLEEERLATAKAESTQKLVSSADQARKLAQERLKEKAAQEALEEGLAASSALDDALGITTPAVPESITATGSQIAAQTAAKTGVQQGTQIAANQVATEATKSVVPVVGGTATVGGNVTSSLGSTLGKEVVTEAGEQLVQTGAKEAGKQVATQVGTEAAKGAAKTGVMGSTSSAVTPIALGATIVGEGVKLLGADDDPTSNNPAEVTGGLLSGMGQGAGYGAMLGTIFPGVGNVVGGIAGAVVGGIISGAKMRKSAKEARDEEEKAQKKRDKRADEYGTQYTDMFRDAYTVQGRDVGFNVGTSGGGSSMGGYQMAMAGARLMAKKGMKLPGGEVLPLPGGAVEFRGNKHGESGGGSDSGIILEESTKDKMGIEVEDKETMDKVKFAGGETDDYIFSSYLKLGGKSFAQRHKEILRSGGSQSQIQDLAKLQEEKAKDVGSTPVGPTDQYGPRGAEYIARLGGPRLPRIQAQYGVGTGTASTPFRSSGSSGSSSNIIVYNTPEVEPYIDPVTQEFIQGSTYDSELQGFADFLNQGGTFDANNPSPLISSNTPVVSGSGAGVPYRSGFAPTPPAGGGASGGGGGGSSTTTPPDPTATNAGGPGSGTVTGSAYEDALQAVDDTGVSYSTEEFKRKGRGSSIDYSGDINSGTWEDVLQTNWAENFLTGEDGTVNTDLTQEDIQGIYNDQYVPQVQQFFDQNPKQALRAIVGFANSGNPNAENLKKKIYNSDGSLKSDEEILQIGLENATDGKVGTFHSLFTGQSGMEEIEKKAPDEIPNDVDKELVTTDDEETIPDEGNSSFIKPPKLRTVPPLAYATLAGNLVGPLAALATKVPTPNQVAPGMQGKERLGRVNYNAERASNLSTTTATNRFIESNVSGPAAAVGMIAANDKSRQNALQIANAEAQQNMQLANAEKQINADITKNNIRNAFEADIRNKAAMDKYNLLRAQTKQQALSQIGTAGAQFATDVMRYQSDERRAGAQEIAGEYTRQRIAEEFMTRPKYRNMEVNGVKLKDMDPRSIDQLAAAAYSGGETSLEDFEKFLADFAAQNPDAVEEQEARYGGRQTVRYGGRKRYTKRSGSVKRKKQKK